MIIALAGRRVDGPDANAVRFPLQNVAKVRTQLRLLLQDKGATAVVSSAACGADLIALSEAGRLGLKRRVILPFERRRFRETSVTDRCGDWGRIYDDVLDVVESQGELMTLRGGPKLDDEAYSAVNRTILDEAVALAKTVQEPAAAVLVWDGVSRGEHDLTEEFGIEARRRGLAVAEVPTN